MFAKSIVLTDSFLDMPMSARCLYFTLGMVADDDGFVDNPKSIMRQCGASMDDMKILLAKNYLIEFETGVIVITHWRINNYLREDRYTPTKFKNEYSNLNIDEDKVYNSNKDIDIDIVRNGIPSGIPTGIPKPVEVSKKPVKRFEKPTVDEVRAYCRERNNNVDAESFVDFYESKGWYVGKNPMKDWKAAVRTWERSRDNKQTGKEITEVGRQQRQEYKEYNNKLNKLLGM